MVSEECRRLLRDRPQLGAAWGEVAALARDSSDYMASHKAAMHLVDAMPDAKESSDLKP